MAESPYRETPSRGESAFELRCWRVMPPAIAVVRFLGPVVGCWVHVCEKKPWGCSGERNCPQKIHREGGQWQGFAAAERFINDGPGKWIPIVLDITARFEQVIHGRQLRGECWALRKERVGTKHLELTGELKQVYDPANLRPEFDCKPAILRVLKNPETEFGLANPLPPRAYLEVSLGDVPDFLRKVDDKKPDAQQRQPSWERVLNSGTPPGKNGEEKP